MNLMSQTGLPDRSQPGRISTTDAVAPSLHGRVLQVADLGTEGELSENEGPAKILRDRSSIE